MSFLITACDKLMRGFSFADSAALLFILVAGCASPTQQKQVFPAAAAKMSEREEALTSAKPVMLPGIPAPQGSSKPTSPQEIKVNDHIQMDTTPIESE